jgi:hypothetical protein
MRHAVPFAAERQQDFDPVTAHFEVDDDRRREQGKGEKERRSQISHSLSP